MKANHKTTDITDYGELYDAIQVGRVPAEMGDIFNERYLMINGFHLIDLEKIYAEDKGKPLYVVTEAVHNTSTGRTFVETYIDLESDEYYGPSHCKRVAVEFEPFEVTHG